MAAAHTWLATFKTSKTVGYINSMADTDGVPDYGQLDEHLTCISFCSSKEPSGACRRPPRTAINVSSRTSVSSPASLHSSISLTSHFQALPWHLDREEKLTSLMIPEVYCLPAEYSVVEEGGCINLLDTKPIAQKASLCF